MATTTAPSEPRNTASPANPTSEAPPNLERWYMPKLWHGMTFSAWCRMLGANRFQVDWRRWPLAAMITLFSLNNSASRAVQNALYAKRLRHNGMGEDPVFIVGHWRSGTTLLHELLTQDPRFTYPTTYECFSPNHFLMSEDFVTRFFGFLLPGRRLPDRMQQGWQRPQEDEAALANRGLPSPYWKLAFPNQSLAADAYAELDDLTPAELDRWEQVFREFLTEVHWRRSERIVLKSPTHTFRLGHLRRMFPAAKFLYIERDPRVVIPSTMHLWRVMFHSQGLQVPNYADLEDYVFDMYHRMHTVAERERDLFDANQFHCVRYEELVASPINEMRSAYEALDLGDFDSAAAPIAAYLDQNAGHKTNRYDPPAELIARIEREILAR